MTRRFFFTYLLTGLAAFLLTSSCGWAQTDSAADSDWNPKLQKAEDFNNRPTEWFTHSVKPDWGYQKPQTDTFIVVHPTDGDYNNAPLYVVLHSAGHDVHSCLNCTKTKGNHDIYHAPADFYALFVDCRANMNDWWWGGIRANEQVNPGNAARSTGELQPVEKRVIDTVLWTIKKYKIDPNRVYLCGNSMGGSGTLGLGLRHGNIFAAIKANVPAGVQHAADRLYLPPKAIPTGVQLPDPPICLDYSGTNDSWSNGHEILFNGMKERKYPIIAYWGAFGHANNHEQIEKTNDLINTFDWLSIRRDQLYPVFTNASCDSAIPWPNRDQNKNPGQVNAFFRWTNKTDTAQKVEVALYLVRPETLNSKIFTAPEEAKADVSLRRLQSFQIQPRQTVCWQFGSQSGTVAADADGLITIPNLTISQNAKTLILTK